MVKGIFGVFPFKPVTVIGLNILLDGASLWVSRGYAINIQLIYQHLQRGHLAGSPSPFSGPGIHVYVPTNCMEPSKNGTSSLLEGFFVLHCIHTNSPDPSMVQANLKLEDWVLGRHRNG